MLVPEEVQTFLSVVRAGSLLGGSEAVHTTQSTVSYRIRSLENRLGRRLLLRARGGRGVTLTNDGRTFLEIAQRWEQLSSEAQVLQEEGDLRLSLGSVQVLTRYVLPPLYEHIVNNRQGLSLRLETGSGVDLAERVATGHLHAAYTVFSHEHIDLKVTRLARFPMRIVMNSPPSHLGKKVSVTSLDPNSEIGMPWGADYQLWRHQVHLRPPRLLSDTVNTLAPLLRSQGVWAFVPEFMVPQLQKSTNCSVLHPEPEPPLQSVYRTIRKRDNAATAPEIKFLEEASRQVWPDWYQKPDH
ncbi:LysR family transcriptional regulator [Nesterenkonia ebinurensis]|uniref:LysR family transcriptional regulator n=1 Tax=Nesterenkonia ebinurensis TaxID=2608252 RepID=UPI00123CBA03